MAEKNLTFSKAFELAQASDWQRKAQRHGKNALGHRELCAHSLKGSSDVFREPVSHVIAAEAVTTLETVTVRPWNAERDCVKEGT